MWEVVARPFEGDMTFRKSWKNCMSTCIMGERAKTALDKPSKRKEIGGKRGG